MWGMMRQIAERQGLSGLFAGVVPRVAKIAPSTAIMLASYEVGKEYFHKGLGN
jgi:solute carrier family 25 protein 39/40